MEWHGALLMNSYKLVGGPTCLMIMMMMMMMMMPTMVLHDPIVHEMGDMMHDALYTATWRIFCHTLLLTKIASRQKSIQFHRCVFWWGLSNVKSFRIIRLTRLLTLGTAKQKLPENYYGCAAGLGIVSIVIGSSFISPIYRTYPTYLHRGEIIPLLTSR